MKTRCLSLALAIGVLALFGSSVAFAQTHTVGMRVIKTCPTIPVSQGDTYTCTFSVTNQDPDHGVALTSVTNTFPWISPGNAGNGPTVAVPCIQGGGPVTQLGAAGSATQTCGGSVDETAPEDCNPLNRTIIDRIAATGTDQGPFPFTGAPSSGSATNGPTVLGEVCGNPCSFIVIDEDSIDNGNPPNDFSAQDVNDNNAEIGVRTQLPFFAANVGAVINLWTGTVGDEGWFALKTIPENWSTSGEPADGLLNFWLAGPGLGSGKNREKKLDKIPDVTPLRATGLKMLEGTCVCAIVYDSDVSINYDPLNGNLKGANLGVVAFDINTVTQLTGQSSGSLPVVEVTIKDAATSCDPLGLSIDAPVPISSSLPFDVVP